MFIFFFIFSSFSIQALELPILSIVPSENIKKVLQGPLAVRPLDTLKIVPKKDSVEFKLNQQKKTILTLAAPTKWKFDKQTQINEQKEHYCVIYEGNKDTSKINLTSLTRHASWDDITINSKNYTLPFPFEKLEKITTCDNQRYLLIKTQDTLYWMEAGKPKTMTAIIQWPKNVLALFNENNPAELIVQTDSRYKTVVGYKVFLKNGEAVFYKAQVTLT